MYINQVVCTHVKQAPKHRLATSMPRKNSLQVGPERLNKNPCSSTVPGTLCKPTRYRSFPLEDNQCDTCLDTSWEGRTKTPEISHRYQKMTIFELFEVGDTFSKSHHFGALQSSVFRGVFFLMACWVRLKSGTVKLPNGFWSCFKRSFRKKDDKWCILRHFVVSQKTWLISCVHSSSGKWRDN